MICSIGDDQGSAVDYEAQSNYRFSDEMGVISKGHSIPRESGFEFPSRSHRYDRAGKEERNHFGSNVS